MNATTIREYRKQRARNTPAHVALAIAKQAGRDYGWTDETPYGERWSREVDGFHVALRVEQESYGAIDGEGMGHYVEVGRDYHGYGSAPDLSEDTPLGLPASHFIYEGGGQGDYGAFFPDGVEDEYRYMRTAGGMSRGAARDAITAWVEEIVRDCTGADYENLVLVVKVSRNGIELASDALGADFIRPTSEDIFAMVDDHGMIEQAIDEAREALAGLCAAN